MQRSQAEFVEPLVGPGAQAPSVLVLLFGALREAAGWKRREVPLPAPTGSLPTPALLWRQLLPGGPELAGGPIQVAVNHQFAEPDTVLHPGDEVAFLPPISGG